jgi:hypothetical protein
MARHADHRTASPSHPPLDRYERPQVLGRIVVAMAGTRPNLFLIGAMKSGTTYLTKLLGSHPKIFMCNPEEPAYFANPDSLRKLWPSMWREGYWRSEERYLSLFRSANEACIIGESSTIYTKRPLVSGIPERIWRFSPNARVIYIMRDPIERAISHYWHSVHYDGERRPMSKAIRDEPHYSDVSHYAMQLVPFLECFGAERVRLLTFEELIGSPINTMARLFHWLGVDPILAPHASWNEPENVTPGIVHMAGWYGIPRRLRQSRQIAPIIPYLPPVVWSFARRLVTREICSKAVDPTEAIKFLRPLQVKQCEALAQLTGRRFTEWKTLYDPVTTP